MRILLTVLICSLAYACTAGEPTPTATPNPISTVVTVHGSIQRREADKSTPVNDATVRLKINSKIVRETFAQDGEFTFYKVKPGDYDLQAELRDSHYVYEVTISKGAPICELAPVTLSEWVYYGNRYAPDKPGWEELLFHRAAGDDQDLPQVGDVVIATKDVSVRQGPVFRDGPDLFLELETGKTVGKGDRLAVQQVRSAFPGNPPDKGDGSVWIRFTWLR